MAAECRRRDQGARGALYTCRAPPRRIFDFAVVSGKAQPLVRGLELVTDVPWAPHFGIRLTVSARPFEVTATVLRRPPPLFGRRRLHAHERRGGTTAGRRAAERPIGASGGAARVTAVGGGLEGLEARGENSSAVGMPFVSWQQASRMAGISPFPSPYFHGDESLRGAVAPPSESWGPLTQADDREEANPLGRQYAA